MRFCDTILKHMILKKEMEKACVPDALLEDYEEEELLNLSRKINQVEAGGQIAKLSRDAVEYLVKDQGFLPFLIRLSQEECYDPVRVIGFLSNAGDMLLSEEYSYEEVFAVLADGKIEPDWTYTYLKYFSSVTLTEEEKGYLMRGLYTLDECGKFSIGDLTEKERRLLAEPMISGGFLREMVQDRSFWKHLLDPGYYKLIKELSSRSGWHVCLMHKQENVLWEHAQVIHAGLNKIPESVNLT